MLTPELIKVIAPHARDDYVKSLTSDGGWMTLARYKITDKVDRLAGFLANCMHETGGLIILRESLNYKTPKRLREVWPSRFGSKSDAELLKLCGNEKALASVVYNGRMGNRPGTDDGYIFRGAGYLQTTGREGFIKYGKLVGIDFSADPPPSTDDANALLVMAAAEWAAGSCNELCEAGNFAGPALSSMSAAHPRSAAWWAWTSARNGSSASRAISPSMRTFSSHPCRRPRRAAPVRPGRGRNSGARPARLPLARATGTTGSPNGSKARTMMRRHRP